MAVYYAQLEGIELGIEVIHNEQGTRVRTVHPQPRDEHTPVDFAVVHVSPETGEGLYSLLIGGRSYQVYIERQDGQFGVALWRHRFNVRVHTEREWRLLKSAPRQISHSGSTIVKAPMPGLVKAVLVAPADSVTAGQRLLVLEAMKMENELLAPRDGVIKEVHVEPGAVVDGGRPLVTIE